MYPHFVSPSSATVVPETAPPLFARLMESEQEVARAQHLLFDVYCDEMGWIPRDANPSGLRADRSTRRLEDLLDRHALWVGVFDGGRLVGTARLLRRSVHGRLELERYTRIPPHLLEVEGEIVEPNRLAILPSHRDTQTLSALHAAIEGVASGLGATRAFAAMTPRRASLVRMAFGWKFAGRRFRYHADDPEPCELIRFDPGSNATTDGALGSPNLEALRAAAARRL